MFGMPDVFDIVNETTNAMKQRRNIDAAMKMWITTSDPASKQFLESNGIVVPPSVQQLQQQQQQQLPPLLQQYRSTCVIRFTVRKEATKACIY